MTPRLPGLLPDLRHTVRHLLRTPGPTVVVILTLALGLGANTAIFSVVRGVLLAPLPYEDPGRLVLLANVYGDSERGSISVPELFFYRQIAGRGAIDTLAGLAVEPMNLMAGDEAVRVLAPQVSPSYFPLLGVKAALGRTFRPEEEKPGHDRVVVLSHGLWQDRFGSDPSVLGRMLSLDGTPHEVIGVLPEGFVPVGGLVYPGNDVGLWKPLTLDLTSFSRQRAEIHDLTVVGRLAEGVAPEAASAAFAPAVARLEETFPEILAAGDRGVRLYPLSERVTAEARPTLLLLLAAVAFVLLIACANVANLRLVAASARAREIAVRRALGATGGRLMRHLLAESLLLSAVGGVLGVLLAVWGVDALRAILPVDLPRVTAVALDAQVLLFATTLAAVTGVLSGLAPALLSRRVELSATLREGDRRSGSSRSGLRFRNALVTGEVAVAAVLLVGAGLLLHSLWHLHRVDPGIDTEGVLSLYVHLPSDRYDGPAKVAYYRRLVDEVATLPGVTGVGMAQQMPPSQNNDWPFHGEDGEWISADPNLVSPSYFETLGIPVVRGRGFTEADSTRASGVVLLNETAARRAFGDENPLGRRINSRFGEPQWMEVVGVVADVKSRGLGRETRPQTYFPLRDDLPMHTPRSMVLLVRSSGRSIADPEGLARQLRRRIAALDPEVAVADVQPLSDVVSATLSEPRVTSWLLGLFAAVALALAALGIYGVLAFTVSGRIPELGLRMALGARRTDIVGLVMRQGLAVIALGLGLGLLASVALGRLLSSWMFGVQAGDPLTLALASLPLTAVALLACWLPARRAARVDPMVALRRE